ncbi:MFS general substrate transporter [Xylariaceae sp. FL1272]|nr:MFS general substrate transporter [Xylariaceae sp. FL1272]
MSTPTEKGIKPTAVASSDDASVGMGHVKSNQAPSGRADVAAQYANYFVDGDTYSKQDEWRLRWKIDVRLVPLLWFNVTLGAMDKVTTATAQLYGLSTATHLKGNEYSWVGSAFYFGYLLWSLPSGSILQKLPLAKVLCIVQLLWGFVLIGTGFSQNFATLVAVRVILGALEAAVVPGNLLILSMWYTRAEQPLRAGLMYTGLSVLFTGPIGWGIGFIHSDENWRAMFWITGAITVVWSLVIGVFLPDNPVTAKFLSPREKAIAIERIRADQTGIENKTFNKKQMIEAFTDPKTWFMLLFQLSISIPNGGLTNFAPLVIRGLGYTSQRSTLITMPTGIIQTVSSYICNGGVFLCIRFLPQYQTRTAWILFGLVVGLISATFLYTLPLTDYYGRLAALYLSYFYLGPYIVSLGLNTANTAGHTKKVTLNALVFIAYCVSNIVAPQFFRAEQSPVYTLGIAAVLGSYVLSTIFILMYAGYCIYENRRRDRVDEAAGERVHADTDFKDLTDKENVHFRYVW